MSVGLFTTELGQEGRIGEVGLFPYSQSRRD